MSVIDYVQFRATVIRKLYDNGKNWKLYAMNPIENNPAIQLNQYGNVTISGDLQELEQGVEYLIIAEEVTNKYGLTYKVKHIDTEAPVVSGVDAYKFLCMVTSEKFARTLSDAYPDILDIMINNKPIDLSKTYGIKDKMYSIIRDNVLRDYPMVNLIMIYGGVLSEKIIRSLYNRYTSAEQVQKNMKNNPYECLCSISNVGFIRADEMILRLAKNVQYCIDNNIETKINIDPDIKYSKERCLYCMIHVLNNNEDGGNSYLTVESIKDSVLSLCPDCANHMIECINDEKIYYNRDLMIIANKRTYEAEKYIVDTIVNALTIHNDYDIDVSVYKNIGDFELSDEQTSLLDVVCHNSISILNGCAGTGKSFTIKALIKMLEDNGKVYRLMTPTGKAAKVVREYTGKQATTIHIGLGVDGFGSFSKNEDNKLCEDVIILDEFSMVDIFLCEALFKAIDFNTTKLVIIGDNSQLLSVSCGNLLHEFINSNLIPKVSLTRVFRYADGGLMMVATDVRNGDNYFRKDEASKIEKYGDDYCFINCAKENIVDQAMSVYQMLLNHGVDSSDICVLSAQRIGDYGSDVLNKRIQKIVNKNVGSSVRINSNDVDYYIGDIIMQTRNNYRAKTDDDDTVFIANGESGIVVDISYNTIWIKFDDGTVRYTYSDLENTQLGYAMTVHKSQGSSAKYVIFVSPESHTFMLNSNLIYVALTRTSHMCYHLGNKQTVCRAIKKLENIKRNTFTGLLLADEAKKSEKF